MRYDVAIAGCGLAGLQCGYILSKQGYKVCLLEQHSQIGGCLQTFQRKDALFDTGFHFVGGLDEGQPLNELFRYFDLLDLPWQKLDEEGFVEVFIEDESYRVPSGYDRFIEDLSGRFPHQRKNLENFATVLQKVEENIFHTLKGEATDSMDYFSKSAREFLEETIDDPRLRLVLANMSMTMPLGEENLPLYVYAQINNSFIRSSWRLKGGGAQITDRLAARIRQYGGTILTHALVSRLIETDGKITSLEYNWNERIEADWFISTLHPANTLALIPESKHIRNIYRKRIASLPNSKGMLTANIRLKKGMIPYQNRNIVFYTDDRSLIKSDSLLFPIMVHFYPPEDGEYAEQIDILSPANWQTFSAWEDTLISKRGEDYEVMKQVMATGMIFFLSRAIPGLVDAIDKIYISTPLTYRDYTGTPEGSAFGILKDYANVMGTLIPVQTQIPNLLLSGQNLNLYGVLGVTMTSLMTCEKITASKETK